MFYRFDNKIVNFDSVSYIRRDGNMYKFNMCYPVTPYHDHDSIISDYVNVFADTAEIAREIEGVIEKLEWIDIDPRRSRVINPSKISFVKFDDKNSRIIVNVSTSISLKKINNKWTSDFVYFTYDNKDEYEKNIQIISNLLSID